MSAQTNAKTSADATQSRMNALLVRSAADAAFRAKLIANPHETLSEFLGSPIDPSTTIAVVENLADNTFVLPPLVGPGAELPEHDLEAVSGGTDAVAIAASAWVVASVASAIAGSPAVLNWWDRHTPEQQVITDEMMNAAPGY
jgi:hypothetical protein